MLHIHIISYHAHLIYLMTAEMIEIQHVIGYRVGIYLKRHFIMKQGSNYLNIIIFISKKNEKHIQLIKRLFSNTKLMVYSLTQTSLNLLGLKLVSWSYLILSHHYNTEGDIDYKILVCF